MLKKGEKAEPYYYKWWTNKMICKFYQKNILSHSLINFGTVLSNGSNVSIFLTAMHLMIIYYFILMQPQIEQRYTKLYANSNCIKKYYTHFLYHD